MGAAVDHFGGGMLEAESFVEPWYLGDGSTWVLVPDDCDPSVGTSSKKNDVENKKVRFGSRSRTNQQSSGSTSEV
jgi:hypothetical protein